MEIQIYGQMDGEMEHDQTKEKGCGNNSQHAFHGMWLGNGTTALPNPKEKKNLKKL